MPDKFKIKIKSSLAIELIQLIDAYLLCSYVELKDKMIIAGMAEIKICLMKKCIEHKKEYSVGLTPVQCLSLACFYDEFIDENTSYAGSKLMLITNEIKQKFN